MIKNGIDVSKWQGTIDWNQVKASGVEFAVLRAGFGKTASQKDVCFDANYNGCKAAGIPCGVYWYSYAASVAEAKQEAAACLEVIKGKQFEYPIYLDIEEKSQFALGKSVCSAIVKAFLETVENAGYWVGIYASKSPLETYVSEELRNRYAVWVAHYGVAQTNYNGDFGIWQKSGTGRISGISGNVDLDVCYVDYPALIKAKGMNGFTAGSEPQQLAEKTIAELAQEVIDGKWGNGQKRKDRLTAAGYDYVTIQTAVNELVSAAQRTHTVAKGDTLTSIAEKYNTTVQAILEANSGIYDFIQIGWVLKI